MSEKPSGSAAKWSRALMIAGVACLPAAIIGVALGSPAKDMVVLIVLAPVLIITSWLTRAVGVSRLRKEIRTAIGGVRPDHVIQEAERQPSAKRGPGY